MIYLYLKTHNITGMNYLGKTEQNPFVYMGSGKRWLSHLKKHGNDVTTKIIKECRDNEEVKKWGLFYSDKFNVVESNNFANLKPEMGDGGSYEHTEETKLKMKLVHQNRSESKEQQRRKKISEAVLKHIEENGSVWLGKKHTQETIEKMKNAKLGKKASEETKQKMKEARVGYRHSEETKQKIALGNINKSERFSAEAKSNLQTSMKAVSSVKIVCPHCGKETNRGNAARWHFDNCKSKA